MTKTMIVLAMAMLSASLLSACDKDQKDNADEANETDDEAKKKGKRNGRNAKGDRDKGNKRNKSGDDDTAPAKAEGDTCTQAASCCEKLAEKSSDPASEKAFCENMRNGKASECEAALKLLSERAKSEGVDCS